MKLNTYRCCISSFERPDSEESLSIIIEYKRPYFTHREFKGCKDEMFDQLVQYVSDNEYPVNVKTMKPYRRVKNHMVKCEVWKVGDNGAFDEFLFMMFLERDEFFGDDFGYFNIAGKWSKTVSMKKFR